MADNIKRMFLLENKFFSSKDSADGAVVNKALQVFTCENKDRLINVDSLEVETKLYKIIPVGTIEFIEMALKNYYGIENFEYQSLIEEREAGWDSTIYRAYVHNDECIELRRISGGLFRFPDKLVIMGFIARWAEKDRPDSYTVDFEVYGGATKPFNMYPFMGFNIANFYSKQVLDMLEDGIDWYIKRGGNEYVG